MGLAPCVSAVDLEFFRSGVFFLLSTDRDLHNRDVLVYGYTAINMLAPAFGPAYGIHGIPRS